MKQIKLKLHNRTDINTLREWNSDLLLKENEHIFMYTGCLDKDGNEICEGDYVRFYTNVTNESLEGLVVYGNGMFLVAVGGGYPLGLVSDRCSIIAKGEELCL